MNWLKHTVGTVLMLLPICVVAGGLEASSSDRAIQFLTNAHTGVSMEDSEWLSVATRTAPNFVGFGGLSALVNQSTAFAREFNGLKSVEILDVADQGNVQRIRAEVKFLDDKRRSASPAAAERKAMIWTFVATKEDGKWKLSF